MSLPIKNQTNVKSENRLDFADAATRRNGINIRVHPILIVPVNFLVHDKGKSPPGGS